MSMSISIKHLAKLSNLQLSQEQMTVMEKSIPAVVQNMETIKQLKVPDVAATNGVSEEENIYREDIPEPSLSQEEALKNAKNTYKGFFVVPYVFEEDEDALK